VDEFRQPRSRLWTAGFRRQPEESVAGVTREESRESPRPAGSYRTQEVAGSSPASSIANRLHAGCFAPISREADAFSLMALVKFWSSRPPDRRSFAGREAPCVALVRGWQDDHGAVVLRVEQASEGAAGQLGLEAETRSRTPRRALRRGRGPALGRPGAPRARAFDSTSRATRSRTMPLRRPSSPIFDC
jgi:hypothetical protein